MNKLLLLIAICFIALSAGAQNCGGLQPLDNTFSVVPFQGASQPYYRCDDGSSSAIQLPFTFCYYGASYSQVYINNNGNISLNAAYGTFSSSSFPSPSYSMIAPFWADADTRNAMSGLVYYKLTPSALIVRWNQIGYYSNMADKVNNFQLIITDGNDPILPAGTNMSFAYGDMQWTTGNASGGINGFGGTPATAGYNKGDGINFFQIGRFNSSSANYDGPYGNNDGIDWLDNKTYFFNTCTTATTTQPVVVAQNFCDTITLCQGDTFNFQLGVSAAPIQNLTVNYTAPGLNVSNVSTYTGTPAFVGGLVSHSGSTPGVHPMVLDIINNTNPADTTPFTLYLRIRDYAMPTITATGDSLWCSGYNTPLIAPQGFDSYYWLPNGADSDTNFVTQPGSYTVTVSDSGCTATSPPIIVSPAFANLPSPVTDTIVCSGDVVTLSANQADTYMWSYEYSLPDSVIGNTFTFMPTLSGILTVVAIDTVRGCTKGFAAYIQLDICDIINEQTVDIISIYPNPANNNLVWSSDLNNKGIIEIYTATGQLVYSKNITDNIENIPLNHLAQGTYYLKTILKDGVKVCPFVKIAN